MLVGAEILTASPGLWEPTPQILQLKPDLVLISCEGESEVRVCEACKDIKQSGIPVLIVQSDTLLEKRLKTLSLSSASMDITHTEEMLKAWVALRRRMPAKLGNVTIDPDGRRLCGPEGDISLTPTEFQVLDMIVAAEGHLVDRQQILEGVWGIQSEGSTGHVKHVVWMLRNRLLSAGGTGKELQTVRGHGYRVAEAFLPQTTSLQPSASSS